MLPMGVAPEVASKRSRLLVVSSFLIILLSEFVAYLPHCESLVIDAERWQRAHDSAQDALTAMNGIVFFACCCV